MRVPTLLIALLALAAPASAAAAANPWLSLRTMNIAHQGGEDEAPSNTMYAYKRALALGADMLEVDFHSTADGRLVVLHDARVDRTTNGTGFVYDMTLAQVQALDAAHDFGDHSLRGVRTGAKPPPPGFAADDFRIPTLDEVLAAYPQVPINIEIKGAADADTASFLRNAELLAALLKRIGRSDGVIVASFSDLALSRFHELAPDVGLAPGIAGIAAFTATGLLTQPGTVALQVPITFEGVQVTNAATVQQAHERGYAVHVWLSNDREDRATYERLLSWNVDGIMAAAPAALEELLCERRLPRPELAFARHCAAAEPGAGAGGARLRGAGHLDRPRRQARAARRPAAGRGADPALPRAGDAARGRARDRPRHRAARHRPRAHHRARRAQRPRPGAAGTSAAAGSERLGRPAPAPLRRQPSAMTATPAATIAAPAQRAARTRSPSTTTASPVAMTTLDSRTAATGAASASRSAASVSA